MLNYRNTPPTPVRLDNRNSGCGPVYCGSFELLLNLSDRGRPAISMVMLPRQQDQANLAKTPGPLASISISSNQGGTLSSQEQAPRPRINIFHEDLARHEQPIPVPFGKPSPCNQPNVSPSDLGLTRRQRDVLALMMQ